MSATVAHALPAARVEAETSAQAAVDVAIMELLRRGFYCRVSCRLNMALLSRWQRWGYQLLCRWLPAWCRLPPAPLGERGGLSSFVAADLTCTTPDHVLQILPYGWTYHDDCLDVEVACRPRDESDTQNYERLKAIFGAEVAPQDYPRIGAEELRVLLERVTGLGARADRLNVRIEHL